MPLVFPASHVFLVSRRQALSAGLALGLGFGIGEAAYLAYGMALSPAYAGYAWYLFTGFMTERIFVSFGHGFMTSLAVQELHLGGRKAVLGYLGAVGLHALLNLGAMLMGLKLLPASLSSLMTYAVLTLALLVFQKNLRAGRKTSHDPDQDTEITYFERGEINH